MCQLQAAFERFEVPAATMAEVVTCAYCRTPRNPPGDIVASVKLLASRGSVFSFVQQVQCDSCHLYHDVMWRPLLQLSWRAVAHGASVTWAAEVVHSNIGTSQASLLACLAVSLYNCDATAYTPPGFWCCHKKIC